MREMEVPPANGPTPRLSAWQRVVFTFTAPTRTFADIERGNRSWWLPFLLLAAASYILCAAITFRIGWGQVAGNILRLDPQAQAQMQQLPPEQLQRIRRIALYSTEGSMLASPLLTLAGIAVLSLGLWGTINFVFGGRATYGGVFAVWMYAGLPGIVKMLLGTIAILAGAAPESFNLKNFAPTNVGAFLDPLATHRALYVLATSVDAVTLWTMVLLGMGTAAVAGLKRGSGWMAVFGWWVLWVLVRVGIAAAFS
ncbi:MAG: YIP1 family protein [Terracidiphilus sp.]